VKLGVGIREIEFVTQALQLLRRRPANRSSKERKPFPPLDKLVQYELLSGEESKLLTEAYCFLRDVEPACKWRQSPDTHHPGQPADRERLGPFDGVRDCPSSRPRARLTRGTSVVSSTGSEGRHAEGKAPFPVPAPVRRRRDGWKNCWPIMLSKTWISLPCAVAGVRRGGGIRSCFTADKPTGASTVCRGSSRLPATDVRRRSTVSHFRGTDSRDAVEHPHRPYQTSALRPRPRRTRSTASSAAYGARATLFELWNRTLRSSSCSCCCLTARNSCGTGYPHAGSGG